MVWLLRKAAEQDIEIGCDEAVISGKDRTYREEYSDVIMAWVARSNRKRSAVSTGYVQGVRFVKRRFDSIIGGGKVYAVRGVPINYGIEISVDLDGDGKDVCAV